MPYQKTLEEGLKEFDEIDIDWEYIYELKRIKSSSLSIQDFEQADYWIKDKLKSFLSSFAEKIREEIVGEVKEYTKEKGFFGDEDFRIVYVDDLLAQLKDK